MTHPLLPLIGKKICDKTLCSFIKKNKLNMSSAKMQVQTPASKRLSRQFYDVGGEDLAKALLGQNIVRMVNGTRLCARIVETEAYLGGMDKAAHSYKGQTDRNKAMFMEPGTAYVYTIYGMHYCFNISSQGAGCAVLIRSVEPLEGVEKMVELRKQKKKSSTSGRSSSSSHKVHQLTNGPAKLCQAMAISKQQLNQRDLVTDTEMWLEEGEAINSDHVVVSARINIAYAEEWTDKPLRFYLLHNHCVSVRDKAAEKQLEGSGALSAAAPNTSAQKQKGISKMDAAKSDKLGKRKVPPASSVDDDKVGTAGRAKTARKERETTSQYFSTT